MKARIAMTGHCGSGSIRLDGVEISHAVSGFTLAGAAGHRTTLTLDVLIVEHSSADLDADVEVPAATALLLEQLGWTPPPSESSAA